VKNNFGKIVRHIGFKVFSLGIAMIDLPLTEDLSENKN